MSTTNRTANYNLSQYVGSDVTSYLTNYNADMSAIDAQMKANADAASTANTNASNAITTANAAANDASTAITTANAASNTANSAQTAAQEAQTAAGAAQTDAAAALTASEANNIGNLAPAYDPTLTYELGDLVTYVDPETNRGALYKCIVAVASPEAFNINKWDDVTASESFRHETYEVIAEVTGNGIKTVETILTELKADMGDLFTSVDKETSILVTQPDGGVEKYNYDSSDSGNAKWSNVDISASENIVIRMIAFRLSRVQSRLCSISTDGTVTNTSNLSDIVANGVKYSVVIN